MSRGPSLMGSLVALSLVVPVSCTSDGREETVAQEYAAEEVRATYEAFSQAWFAAFNTRNLDRLLGLYALDAIRMPPEQPALRGPDAIRADFRRIFSTYDSTHIDGISQDVRFSGDWAMERGAFTYAVKPAAGEAATRQRGKYIVVAQWGSDGAWRILWEIWNSNTPEPEPEASESESEPEAEAEADPGEAG